MLDISGIVALEHNPHGVAAFAKQEFPGLILVADKLKSDDSSL